MSGGVVASYLRDVLRNLRMPSVPVRELVSILVPGKPAARAVAVHLNQRVVGFRTVVGAEQALEHRVDRGALIRLAQAIQGCRQSFDRVLGMPVWPCNLADFCVQRLGQRDCIVLFQPALSCNPAQAAEHFRAVAIEHPVNRGGKRQCVGANDESADFLLCGQPQKF